MIDIGSLTGWDWFVLGALLISTLWGVLSGLVRTVFALAGWVIGLIGAPLATPHVLAATGWNVHPLFVMALLFFLIIVMVRLLGILLSRALSKVGLGGVDRGLGALLGVARALLIITVAVVIGHGLGLDREPAWQRAQSRPLLEQMLAFVAPLLPESFGQRPTVPIRRT